MGISIKLEGSDNRLIHMKNACGTPIYYSPEIIFKLKYDYRVKIVFKKFLIILD
jgi:hypothetical protein